MSGQFSLRDAVVVVGIAIIVVCGLVVFRNHAARHHHAGLPPCRSNLRQIGYGLIMYLNDYEDQWPSGETTAEALGHLFPDYLDTVELFHCPDGPDPTYDAVSGSIVNGSYWMDLAIPADCDSQRGVVGDRLVAGRDSYHGGGMNLLCADSHVVWCARREGGLYPNPAMHAQVATHLYEDTDVYSSSPAVADIYDCWLRE